MSGPSRSRDDDSFTPPPRLDPPPTLDRPPFLDAPYQRPPETAMRRLDRVFGRAALWMALAPFLGCCCCCAGMSHLRSIDANFSGGEIGLLLHPVFLATVLLWYGVTPALPGWLAVWLGTSLLARRGPKEPRTISGPGAVSFFLLAILLLMGQTIGLMVIVAMAGVYLWVWSRGETWRLLEPGERGDPVPLRFSIGQLVLATALAAVVFGIARNLASGPEPGFDTDWGRVWAAALLLISSGAVIVLAAASLFLAADRPRLGWLVTLTASIVPGLLVAAVAPPRAMVTVLTVLVAVPHGLALCAFLQYAHASGVRIVRRTPEPNAEPAPESPF